MNRYGIFCTFCIIPVIMNNIIVVGLNLPYCIKIVWRIICICTHNNLITSFEFWYSCRSGATPAKEFIALSCKWFFSSFYRLIIFQSRYQTGPFLFFISSIICHVNQRSAYAFSPDCIQCDVTSFNFNLIIWIVALTTSV